MAQPIPKYASIKTSREYDALLNAYYMKATARVGELTLPPVKVITVSGNEPPASRQYADAIAVLYGIAYTLKMGLKFKKLRRPAGYFDYRVGALETLWWSTEGPIDICDPKTLRWTAYLMVPRFVTPALCRAAREQARNKHPDLPYDLAVLETVREGRVAQVLHIGPYDQETLTIARLHAYVAEEGLKPAGKHHEIYLSDPRRTAPAKLKTVIRQGVT
jgi:hypothetical protein